MGISLLQETSAMWRNVSIPFALVLCVCVVFFQFSGPLETGLHHAVMVPDRCCLEKSYNRRGLPGKTVSLSSYLADPYSQ